MNINKLFAGIALGTGLLLSANVTYAGMATAPNKAKTVNDQLGKCVIHKNDGTTVTRHTSLNNCLSLDIDHDGCAKGYADFQDANGNWSYNIESNYDYDSKCKKAKVEESLN